MTKEAHQSAKFQTFDCSGEISPNLYFDRVLFLKVYKISARKVLKSYCLMTLKSDAKFEEKPICCFKNDKNLVNFDPSIQVSKICTLIGPFSAKYIKFDLKRHRGVIFHDTEESCKISRKTNLWFGKNVMRNFVNFHQITQKIQNWDFYGVLLSKKENV